MIDLLIDNVFRMPLKHGHPRNKTPCRIFQEGPVGPNGDIAESLLNHASAFPELLPGLEHGKVEPTPTHSGQYVSEKQNGST